MKPHTASGESRQARAAGTAGAAPRPVASVLPAVAVVRAIVVTPSLRGDLELGEDVLDAREGVVDRVLGLDAVVLLLAQRLAPLLLGVHLRVGGVVGHRPGLRRAFDLLLARAG